jgi:thimet oligopeptidase
MRRVQQKRSIRVALAVWFVAGGMISSLRAQTPADSPARDALAKAEEAVQGVIGVSGQRTFENTLGALDDLLSDLENDTNMMMFMAHVSPDEATRERGSTAEEHVTNWLIDLQKREDLYKAVKAYADSNPHLNGARARLLSQTLRDYRRAGMELDPEMREKLTTIQKEVNRLGIEFEKNISADETRVYLTREELSGVPDDVLNRLTETNGVYLVGMDYPTFLPIQDYCDNETTRKKVWLAYKRRGGLKNVGVLEKILELRAQAASILGYAHPADYETEVRMAKSAKTVMDFYTELRPVVRKKAEVDWQAFLAAKREHSGDPDAGFYPWDFSFYKNLLKKTKYAVDSQQVTEYFPMERVKEGLFSITQSLYGLEYRDVTSEAAAKGIELWHDEVQLYEVYDKLTKQVIGMFTLDLFPRDNKYGHAAQWGLRQHKTYMDGHTQKPLAALVCNFPRKTDDKPSLMPHDQVETFFHEFGHCLHTIVSEVDLYTFSGTSVARDFVEAPSQMFENWIWNADVLKTFAKHYETGETIPQAMLDGMIAARNLGSGLEVEHQIYYGLCDMAYHTAPGGEVGTTQVGLDLFDEVELYDAVPETYYQASFGHLVGYQAGYYSYLWSKVYAADMFERFKELGMLDPEAGVYYRRKILARGGTMDAMDLVRDYLGREPNMDAFLKQLGLN